MPDTGIEAARDREALLGIITDSESTNAGVVATLYDWLIEREAAAIKPYREALQALLWVCDQPNITYEGADTGVLMGITNAVDRARAALHPEEA